MKKLLIVTTVPETIATILKGQPEYLNNHFDVSIATSFSSGKASDQISEAGVDVHRVSMVRGISVVQDIFSLVTMFFLIRKLNPDIVHSYTPKAGLIAMSAAWACRVPIRVHTFTGLIFPTSKGFRKTLLMCIDRVVCYCASRVVPEGRGVAKDLARFSITKKPLHVIGSGNIAGIDSGFFFPDDPGSLAKAANMRVSLNVPEDHFVFCYVGRLNADKGIYELARAFGKMTCSTLIIVGDDDASSPIDPETRCLLENNPNVHFLGFQKDIRPALICSDLLVLPSYREGFPNVLLQAGSMAKPVIATDINGCNEIVVSGKTGWLVNVRDQHDLYCAMSSASQLPRERLAEMGNLARTLISSNYEQKDHWLRMLEFYKSELGNEAAI